MLLWLAKECDINPAHAYKEVCGAIINIFLYEQQCVE